jgi:dipeptidase
MEDLSPYLPIYEGLREIPRAFQIQDSLDDEQSLYWNVRRLQALVFQNYPKYAPWAHAAIAQIESGVRTQQTQLEAAYLSRYRKDPSEARSLIQSVTGNLIADAQTKLDAVSLRIMNDLGTPLLTHTQIIQMLINVESTYHFGGA